MTPNTSPLEDMRAALAAHDRAARAVAESLDYWLGITPSMHIPTSLLNLVDAYRETGAQMLAYLPEAPTGPTQDQTPQEAYQNGFLSVAEYNQRVQEPAHDWATQAGFDAATIERHKNCGPECPVTRVVAKQQEQQAAQEAADNAESPSLCQECGDAVPAGEHLCKACFTAQEGEDEEGATFDYAELAPDVMGRVSPYTHDRLPWE